MFIERSVARIILMKMESRLEEEDRRKEMKTVNFRMGFTSSGWEGIIREYMMREATVKIVARLNTIST